MNTSPSIARTRAFATAASSAPAFWMIGVLWRVMATGIQTGGSFCLLDQKCAQESGPARHDHPQDEGLYVLDGSVSFQAGGKIFKAGPGSLVTVPRHTEHSFLVEEAASLLNFYLPAGFEAFLMGSAVPAGGDALPPEDFPPPPMSLLKRLSEDYGGMPSTSERSTRPNPDAIAEPMVFTAASAPGCWYEGARWSVLADATSTGGSYCAFKVDLPAGATLGLHVRDVTDEAYYLLEGEAEMLMDDQAAPMATRSLSYAPRGTVTASRAGASGARLLVVHTSPGFERLLAAAGVPATGGGAPQDASPQIDPKRLRDLHADIGLRLLKSLSWPAGSTEVSSDAMAIAPSV